MSFSFLRKADPVSATASAALAQWPLRDASLARRLACVPLARSDMLFTVHAYRRGLCWNGFFNLEEWLDRAVPELAELARSGEREEHVRRARHLFEASECPLQMPFPELSYDSLKIDPCIPAESDAERCWLSLETPQGRVWLVDFPLCEGTAAMPLSAMASTLPLNLEFIIGSSQISRGLITQARRGDVLLVGKKTFAVASSGKNIGQFSINEDGEISVQESGMNKDSVEPLVAAALSDIPLRIDYILQRRTMTIAQIDMLYRGQLLELDPLAEKQVEISANGVCLAKGELVELNGRLGVELQDLTGVNRFARAVGD